MLTLVEIKRVELLKRGVGRWRVAANDLATDGGRDDRIKRLAENI